MHKNTKRKELKRSWKFGINEAKMNKFRLRKV